MKKTAWLGASIILWLSISGAAFAQTASSTPGSASCPQGSFWNGSACVTQQQGCAQSGGSWNGSTCQFPTPPSGSQTPPPTPPPAPQQTPPSQPPMPPVGNASSSMMMPPGNQPSPMPPMPMPPMPSGSNFNPQNGSTTMPQFMNNGGQFFHGDNHMDMHQFDDQQQRFDEQAQKQQSDMMARQAKRMAKEFSSELKRYQRLAKRVTARHLSLPSACADAAERAQEVVSTLQSATSPEDFSSVMQDSQDVQGTLADCERTGQEILVAPTMMKMIKRYLPILDRKDVDVSSIRDEFNTYLMPAYNTITSGTASADDIQTFFDTADDIRSQMEDAFSSANLNLPDVFKSLDQSQGGHPVSVPGSSKASPDTASTTSASTTAASMSPRAASQVASAYQALVHIISAFKKTLHR